MRTVGAALGAVTIGLVSLAVACSSSSNSGSTLPSCQGGGGTGAGSAACNSCIQSNCGSDVSPVESDCTAYSSCGPQCARLSGECPW
jgi:hypothetical protein